MADAFLYLVLFLVALWTARLAMSKGRNPWGWGGAALLLGLVHVPESALLGVAPVLMLLFMKSPAASTAAGTNRVSCPRCAKSHSDGQHFCTGCGWDLSESYSPEDSDSVQQPTAKPQAPVSMPSTAVSEPPPEIPQPAVPTPSAVGTEVTQEPATETESAPPVDSAPGDFEPTGVSGVQDSIDETEVPTQPPADPVEEEPAAPHVPWGTYQPGIAPTAAVMTSRGIERFEAGKYQEAIDQFTKAIALDPDYADALQRRAEAYAQLGRAEQAEADRRHLQRLDPSSSPG